MKYPEGYTPIDFTEYEREARNGSLVVAVMTWAFLSAAAALQHNLAEADKIEPAAESTWYLTD